MVYSVIKKTLWLAKFVFGTHFLELKLLYFLSSEFNINNQVVIDLFTFSFLTVTAVANGLQAWKILGDLTNHIDLVLTEVVMPGLTGIGLLSKIMNHKTCKNIPVISEYSSFISLLKYQFLKVFINYSYVILLTASLFELCVQ